MLTRINRELDGTIDIEAFRHEAIYNPREGRIEMHLISLCDQDVSISGRRFRFREGESIHTENSYKYTVDEFQNLAVKAGWNPAKVWTDEGTAIQRSPAGEQRRVDDRFRIRSKPECRSSILNTPLREPTL